MIECPNWTSLNGFGAYDREDVFCRQCHAPMPFPVIEDPEIKGVLSLPAIGQSSHSLQSPREVEEFLERVQLAEQCAAGDVRNARARAQTLGLTQTTVLPYLIECNQLNR